MGRHRDTSNREKGHQPRRQTRGQPGPDASEDAWNGQAKLGDALGITFQQVQKYEKGTNRIGASRLQHISHILKVPVPFFFEGAPQLTGQPNGFGKAPSLAYVSEFLATTNGLALTKAFTRIREPKLKRRIVDLVEEIVEDDLR
jgi:transcriptional regulator with XRE-family HTH domain